MAVLTQKYRSKTFEEVIGQKLAVGVLKAAAKNPDDVQRVMVLSGGYGCGKTTLARVFGRALSCESFSTTGRICLKCKGCIDFDNVSSRYIEYDSAMVGNVSQIKELKPVFEMYTDYYRVIVLDEAHLISRPAQSSLLKVFEEGPPKTFFLLCSTDPSMILNTIHSRSLPVEFSLVDQTTMSEHVKKVSMMESGAELPDDIVSKIVFKADGHVRDALMILQAYMVSKDASVLDLPIDSIRDFMICLLRKDVQGLNQSVGSIMKYPTHYIHRSLNYVTMQIMVSNASGSETSVYGKIAKALGPRCNDLFKTVSDSSTQGVFKDKYLTAAFFFTLFKNMTR